MRMIMIAAGVLSLLALVIAAACHIHMQKNRE